MTSVRMTNSVGEFVAGKDYELDDETADRFILRGYAEGELSREYADGEAEDITGGTQTVSV